MGIRFLPKVTWRVIRWWVVVAWFPFVAFLRGPSESVRWYSFEEAVKLVRRRPKYIFIDVYTNWCGWCKVMDNKTFKHPKVVEALNKYFYAVKLNAETRDTIWFQGKPHYYIRRYKANLLALRLLDGKMVYPSIAILDPKFRRLIILQGYQTPEKLHPYLIYYGKEYYKTMRFAEFKRKVYAKQYGG